MASRPLRSYIDLKEDIPPENDKFGNIEYKLRLDLKDEESIYEMGSQMLWRLSQSGQSKSMIYYLGIKDNGTIGYLDKTIIDKSINIIANTARICSAEIYEIDKIKVDDKDNCIAEVKLRVSASAICPEELRVCILGVTNHGKSTTQSNMTRSLNDNGKGMARSLVFRHDHEQETGNTSSIKNDVIGLNKEFQLINYKTDKLSTREKIMNKSNIIFNLFDMPGLNKYINTTLCGISRLKPHAVIIIISLPDCIINQGIHNDILQYIRLCCYLNIDVYFIFTKKDLITPELENHEYYKKIYTELEDMLKKYKKDSKLNYISISNKENNNVAYGKFLTEIYQESKKQEEKIQEINHKVTEFIIFEVYKIPDRHPIICGVVVTGCLEVNKYYYLGISSDKEQDKWVKIKINTIHKQQVSCNKIEEFESGSIEVNIITEEEKTFNLTKNMVIVSDPKLFDVNIYDHKKHKIMICSESDIDNLIVGSQYQLFYNNYSEPVIVTNKNKETNEIDIFFVKNISVYITQNKQKNNNNCILKNNTKNNLIFGTFV
jgi:GTPase